MVNRQQRVVAGSHLGCDVVNTPAIPAHLLQDGILSVVETCAHRALLRRISIAVCSSPAPSGIGSNPRSLRAFSMSTARLITIRESRSSRAGGVPTDRQIRDTIAAMCAVQRGAQNCRGMCPNCAPVNAMSSR